MIRILRYYCNLNNKTIDEKIKEIEKIFKEMKKHEAKIYCINVNNVGIEVSNIKIIENDNDFNEIYNSEIDELDENYIILQDDTFDNFFVIHNDNDKNIVVELSKLQELSFVAE